MRIATDIGVTSAILLIGTLILAAVEVIFPLHPGLAVVGAIFTICGLTLVIAAAALVIVENALMQKATQDELANLPNFKIDA